MMRLQPLIQILVWLTEGTFCVSLIAREIVSHRCRSLRASLRGDRTGTSLATARSKSLCIRLNWKMFRRYYSFWSFATFYGFFELSLVLTYKRKTSVRFSFVLCFFFLHFHRFDSDMKFPRSIPIRRDKHKTLQFAVSPFGIPYFHSTRKCATI